MTRMNAYHWPGDHFIIPDGVFTKKKNIYDEEKRNIYPWRSVEYKTKCKRNVTTKPIIKMKYKEKT